MNIILVLSNNVCLVLSFASCSRSLSPVLAWKSTYNKICIRGINFTDLNFCFFNSFSTTNMILPYTDSDIDINCLNKYEMLEGHTNGVVFLRNFMNLHPYTQYRDAQNIKGVDFNWSQRAVKSSLVESWLGQKCVFWKGFYERENMCHLSTHEKCMSVSYPFGVEIKWCNHPMWYAFISEFVWSGIGEMTAFLCRSLTYEPNFIYKRF